MYDFDKLWDYAKPEQTAKKFHKILTQADMSDATYIAQLYTQLARTQSLQANWEEAHKFLDKAKSLLSSSDKVTEVRYLLELGRTYNSSGKKDEAYKVFESAWELGHAVGADGYAVDAAHMLAIAAKNPDDTLDWNLKALDLAETSEKPQAQRWKPSLYNNLGWTYFDKEDYEQALDYLEKAKTEQEKLGSITNIRIARMCVGKIKRVMGDVQEAVTIQEELLGELEADAQEDEFVYEELALAYSTLGDLNRAREYAQKAHDILSTDKWVVKNQPERLHTLKQLL